MDNTLRAVFELLIIQRRIGKRHIPEDKIIGSKTKWLSKEEKRNFEKEYKKYVNEGFILRLKKRTGKGSDWHISLNPGKLKELKNILK